MRAREDRWAGAGSSGTVTHLRCSLRLLVACAATAAALLVPSAAQAAVPWAACAPAGSECATLPVPLDPSGVVPGTIGLNLKRRVSAGNTTGTAVVALAGGPGQAAVPLTDSFAQVLAPGLATRDLLVFDQRGTGGSGPLDCDALRTATSIPRLGQLCSRELGPKRAFYTTAQSVADLEAIRVAAGYTKLALHGVSYGTKVALAYAAAYPQNVESMVLDSNVLPEGPDAFRRSSLEATPRIMSELCQGTLCRGITTDAARDLRSVARKLRRGSLRGDVVSSSGRTSRATLTEAGLFGILLAGDLNPELRAELPGSLRSALTGDVRPLLRLSARSAGLENSAGVAPGTAPKDQAASAADSDALFFATTCEENPTLPWPHGASVSQKTASAVAATRALSPASVAPFSRATALSQGIVPLCLGWEQASPAPVVNPALPAVPTLILDGGQDVRTPYEDAVKLQARIPGSVLVKVPNVGHSVLGADPTSCSAGAVTAFYTAAPLPACATDKPFFSPTPKPATRLAALRPYGNATGTVGRTVQALRLTVNDGRNGVLGATLALGSAPSGVGGLRSGSVRVKGGTLTFRDYEYIPGVLVSGALPARGTATFRVSGRSAARGTVRVSQTLAVTGRLGGRSVSAQFGQAAGAGERLTVRQAEARGRLIAAAR